MCCIVVDLVCVNETGIYLKLDLKKFGPYSITSIHKNGMVWVHMVKVENSLTQDICILTYKAIPKDTYGGIKWKKIGLAVDQPRNFI